MTEIHEAIINGNNIKFGQLLNTADLNHDVSDYFDISVLLEVFRRQSDKRINMAKFL